jgi:hypothetical protein
VFAGIPSYHVNKDHQSNIETTKDIERVHPLLNRHTNDAGTAAITGLQLLVSRPGRVVQKRLSCPTFVPLDSSTQLMSRAYLQRWPGVTLDSPTPKPQRYSC